MTIDINIKYIIRNNENMENEKVIEKKIPKINIGKMPIMLKSSICTLTQNPTLILDSLENVIWIAWIFHHQGLREDGLRTRKSSRNRIYCFDGKNTTKWSWYAEIKSVPDNKCISPKQIEMMVATKNNGFGNGIYVNIPRVRQPIELFVVFRSLGVLSDKDICKYIVLDIDNPDNKNILQFLQASVIDAKNYDVED